MTEDEFLAALRAVDSSTVANAIEGLHIRGLTEGYADVRLRCVIPQAVPMVGRAVTARIDSTSPAGGDSAAGAQMLISAVGNAPQPSVVVFQEVGPEPFKGLHTGGVMCSAFTARGAVGIVTDGAIRDLAELRDLGLTAFASGTVVSHGSHTILEVGPEVDVFGCKIRHGDLLHGNEDGLVVVPDRHPERLLALIAEVRASEAAAMSRFCVDASR